MTLTTAAFNQTPLKPLVYDMSTDPFLSCLAKKRVYVSGVIPGSGSDSTSARPWRWSEGTLSEYWLVCKFDLILAIPGILTSITARHSPYFNSYLLLSKVRIIQCFSTEVPRNPRVPPKETEYAWEPGLKPRGAVGGSAPLNFFCAPRNFVAPRKICSKHVVKAKIVPPLKCIAPHRILKPGYGPAGNHSSMRL